MGLLIFYFTLVVVVSFLCSLLESVLLSIPYSYVQRSVNKGAFYSALLKKHKYQIGRPLSAILTLNTVANTLGSAGVGAQAHVLYGSYYVTVFSIILTFVILVFSEIIPKTLGANYWQFLTPVAVYIIQGLIYVCYPFVIFSRYFTKIIGGQSFQTTREDLIGAFEVASNEGVVYKNEAELLKNTLNLKHKKVSEIMTPRTVITAFSKDMTVSEVVETYQPLRFARIPVYEGGLDQVVGMVNRYKILEAYSQDLDSIKIENYLKPIHSVPEDISLTAVLDQFIKRKEHIFVVVDEYGTVAGLVTMEDVVETILGIEIVDELDPVEDLREQALKQWKQKKSKVQKPS